VRQVGILKEKSTNKLESVGTSFADPGFLSRILILFPYRIPDPGSNNNKKEGRGNLSFLVINYTKCTLFFISNRNGTKNFFAT
jgi:hypothetical protein